ncbi:MAG TPA: tetratricopeptide repeat protein [Rhodanobacter sp.]
MKHARGLSLLASAVLLLGVVSGQALAKDKDKPAAQYPNTTRAEPKLDLTSEKDQKALNEGLDAVNAGDSAKAQQILQPIVDGSKSKYAQALALQGLANIKYKDNDLKGAISLLQRSLDNGVLPNDTYFQLRYEMAQFQLADQQYQASLDTVAKWRAEGKKETAESYALEGNADYRLQKYPEAVAAIKKAQSLTDKPEESWNQILMASYSESGQGDQAAKLASDELAKNPSDTGALHNASAILLQQQKYPEAIKLMEQGRSSGALKDETDWINLVKAYLLVAQQGTDPQGNGVKALQVFDDGLAKGAIKPTAENYKLAGDASVIGEDDARAVGYYQKGAPLAKDGEIDLALGRVQLQKQKYSEAKKSLQSAIDKGVKQKGNAYMLLAESERGLKNKPAAIAAMKLAAQQPETAEKAKAWLKTAGAGK